MSGPGYIIPGHQSPIGAWPLDQLQAARQELAADRLAGFLPASADQAIEALAAEINRREQGGSRELSVSTESVGRALERWFDVRPEPMIPVRGVDASALGVLTAPDGVQRQQETVRAMEQEQELQTATAVAPEPTTTLDLGPITSTSERGRDREVELEP